MQVLQHGGLGVGELYEGVEDGDQGDEAHGTPGQQQAPALAQGMHVGPADGDQTQGH